MKDRGVEIMVCDPSLARSNFSTADVAADVAVAVSAMTVNANK